MRVAILPKKVLIPAISLTSVGGVYLTKSIVSEKEERITASNEADPNATQPTIKERFKNKNSKRVLLDATSHDKVWAAILKEYKKNPDPNLPIPQSEVSVEKIKELCSSLGSSTDEGGLDQYEKYCTRDTWKGSVPNLIEVGNKVKWDKKKQEYGNGSVLPITDIKSSEELPSWCEGRYDKPMDDKEDNYSDYWNLSNWCTWDSSDEQS
ncbi:hypothetical protein HF1_11840 [Mycoplasma haemofelis str. Langford 1]|uniref:Uncharacterized protein n=1 Tax=Mycoplasma haemofelis (strain Langford 1) TaxID=941640 RepID=E8ZJ71_MYCHL|nr:hypothetical protein [Mycoplasma haemofelis]CBY93192.1 hypothetical protein HF1_11840 [Mycoplasma haemofelis str. Langford 1]